MLQPSPQPLHEGLPLGLVSEVRIGIRSAGGSEIGSVRRSKAAQSVRRNVEVASVDFCEAVAVRSDSDRQERHYRASDESSESVGGRRDRLSYAGNDHVPQGALPERGSSSSSQPLAWEGFEAEKPERKGIVYHGAREVLPGIG